MVGAPGSTETRKTASRLDERQLENKNRQFCSLTLSTFLCSRVAPSVSLASDRDEKSKRTANVFGRDWRKKKAKKRGRKEKRIAVPTWCCFMRVCLFVSYVAYSLLTLPIIREKRILLILLFLKVPTWRS